MQRSITSNKIQSLLVVQMIEVDHLRFAFVHSDVGQALLQAGLQLASATH